MNKSRILWGEKGELIIETKICDQCKKEKPLSEFYKQNKYSKNLGYYVHVNKKCKECVISNARKWAIENKESKNEIDKKYRKTKKYKKWNARNRVKQKENLRIWYKNNSDKCKQYYKNHIDHDISTNEEKSLLKIFNYACAYCGMTLEEHKETWGENLHDHVDPNGHNDLRNDVPACRACNCGKYTNDMEEWYKQQEFYSTERYLKIIWWITEGYKDYIEDKPPYKIIRSRIDNEDGTYYYNHELWMVDEKRVPIKLLDAKPKKKELKDSIYKYFDE